MSTLSTVFSNLWLITVTSPLSLISSTDELGITVTGCLKVFPESPSPLPPLKRLTMTSLWQGSIQEANSLFGVTR